MALFRRAVKLTIGTLEVSGLDCAFKVSKSLKPQPNTAEIKIYNLAESSRKQLETAKVLPVRLEAGYEDALSLLYLGEVRSASSTIEGPDVVTSVSTGDSEDQIKRGRIQVPIGAKTPADVALRAIVRALGVKEGNVETAVRQLQAKGTSSFFGPGTVLSGSAARTLSDFARSAGLEWSVQDGRLQILDRGKALETTAIVLSSSTGLVGSPTVDNKGIATAKALMLPDMFPGRKVLFDAVGLKGLYRVTDTEHAGDRSGQDWYVTIHAKRL